jgi:predicted metal-dependent hydrolase
LKARLNAPVQLELLFGPRPLPQPGEERLHVAGRALPVDYVRHERARRYVLRLGADGRVRVTVPRRGSVRAAREFAARHTAWLARQLARQSARPVVDRAWRAGTRIWFRGEPVALALAGEGQGADVSFADQTLPAPAGVVDLRPTVERHLRGLALLELPPRVVEFAATEGVTVLRVSVRNQRSRWGSCSRRGTVSLNWRLVQMPPAVRDYVIWHELMHLHEMNHSARFWRHVARVCPGFQAARAWLRHHGDELR